MPRTGAEDEDAQHQRAGKSVLCRQDISGEAGDDPAEVNSRCFTREMKVAVL